MITKFEQETDKVFKRQKKHTVYSDTIEENKYLKFKLDEIDKLGCAKILSKWNYWFI